MIDDPVHHGIVGEESDDLHRGAALRADHRVNLIDLADHLGPALGGDGPQLILDNPQRKSLKTCLPDLASMGIGVEAVISHCDLALVRNMGSDPGDELQVVHPLYLSGLFPVPIAHLGSLFIEGEALQGQQRADHVFAHQLGLFLGPGPDPAIKKIWGRWRSSRYYLGALGTYELEHVMQL